MQETHHQQGTQELEHGTAKRHILCQNGGVQPVLNPALYEASQWVLLAVIVFGVTRFFKSRENTSNFKPRGPKRSESRREVPIEERESKLSKQRARLLLEGIALTGLPHQILGIRPDASEFEIRKAHRQLIKRFHPDKVGSQGTREWYEAQRASEAINGARDQMLAALKR